MALLKSAMNKPVPHSSILSAVLQFNHSLEKNTKSDDLDKVGVSRDWSSAEIVIDISTSYVRVSVFAFDNLIRPPKTMHLK